MIIVRQLNIQQKDEDKTWLVNLVVQLKAACGKEKALDFAEKFQARNELCILVFELGRDKYEYIHRCVNNWGAEFLSLAINVIYDQEKFAAKDKLPNY